MTKGVEKHIIIVFFLNLYSAFGYTQGISLIVEDSESYTIDSSSSEIDTLVMKPNSTLTLTHSEAVVVIHSGHIDVGGKIEVKFDSTVSNTVHSPVESKNKNLFPSPSPRPSTEISNIRIEGGKNWKMHHLDNFLRSILDSCGYRELRYYDVLEGFAIITGIEQINKEGSPLPEPERWSNGVKHIENLSFENYFSSLFKADKGYFRVMIFIVTSDNILIDGKRISRSEISTLCGSGSLRLSKETMKTDYTNSHYLSILIYEFVVSENDGSDPTLSYPSLNDAKTHLIQSKIWQLLNQK